MDLDDRIIVATPEGLELSLALAGLGSRFIAGAVDLIIQFTVVTILAAITGVLGGRGAGGAAVVYVIGEFVIGLFYFVVFEMLTGGRSPGKRLVHLRVLRATGEPIDLQSSVIRNLMRLIDGATLVYLPSIVCVAVTRRHQRPGDLAAGTIVTREQPGPRKPGESRLGGRRRGGGRGRREKRQRARRELWGAVPQPGGDPAAGRWDASAVTAEEMAAVRRFLERRETIDDAARRELATRLTGGLWPKVTGAPPGIEAERFLEELEQIKRAR